MFYKLIAVALIVMGLYDIVYVLLSVPSIDRDSISLLAGGLSTFLIGVLNYVYLFESPATSLPKIILLGANGLYIGYLILCVTSHFDVVSSFVAMALVLASSLLVLNSRV